MNKLKINKKKGFTLVELSAVLAIVSILSGVALAGISSSRGKVQLETAANEIVAAIRETQNYALTGKIEDDTDICNSFVFSPGITPNSYRISGGPAASCNFSFDKEIGGDVTFTAGSSISFSAPHADKSPSGNTDITISRRGENYHICVNEAGRIVKSPNPGCV